MTFLLTHWRLGLALILTAVLGSYILVLKAELRYETGKRAEAETKVAQLTAAVTQWQEAVKQQNLAVDGWKAAAVQNGILASQAEARARQISAQIPQKVQEILDAKIVRGPNPSTQVPVVSESSPEDRRVPKIPTDQSSQPSVTCEQAITWLKDQAPALSSW